MKRNGPALTNKKKMSRRSSAAVALTVILGFSLAYGVTASRRPAAQNSGDCTACCILPDTLGDLEPVPLEESDWPLRRDASPTMPTLATLSEPARRPTLAPPPAKENVGYGPAIEIMVEAKQLGVERD